MPHKFGSLSLVGGLGNGLSGLDLRPALPEIAKYLPKPWQLEPYVKDEIHESLLACTNNKSTKDKKFNPL